MDINAVLAKAASLGVSDVHIKVGRPPVVRLHGDMETLTGFETVTAESAVKIAGSVMPASLKSGFKDRKEADFAYALSGVARFRVNAYIQRGMIGLVFRVIPEKVPDIDSLLLPDVIKDIAGKQRGLVLVTGITGSGKSTTLASMIDYVNRTRKMNIITVEDPIEFLHADKLSTVSQREVGADTNSFSEALKRALRQDPDMILVGEMRDAETIETALHAAETGHLVMSTLHTSDAPETVNRIVSVFEPHRQDQIRLQLASVLNAVISQRLVPRTDISGRVPAVEVMVTTGAVKECISDKGRLHEITDFIEQGRDIYGSQSFDQSLADHIAAGYITADEAFKWAKRPDDLRLKLAGFSG
ncbi:type IV pilus twitching motility protein PilT [Seleniivibrio sp.]|uniref:type IV pilus twitching motility protein PilT n=1 Tax=Seleniivibrio sp. TaxID=2898801 RepID=UPI002600523E|nr:type IV pilus twitching motility protein PilT [Seleniivibrio sp.]MCD8554305.1 type IV pilus twitching motility protein PilT [Seleniivibrio sp.]